MPAGPQRLRHVESRNPLGQRTVGSAIERSDTVARGMICQTQQAISAQRSPLLGPVPWPVRILPSASSKTQIATPSTMETNRHSLGSIMKVCGRLAGNRRTTGRRSGIRRRGVSILVPHWLKLPDQGLVLVKAVGAGRRRGRVAVPGRRERLAARQIALGVTPWPYDGPCVDAR